MALHEVQLKGYSVRPGNLSLGTFDSYGIEQLHVTLDDTWSGLAVTATFNPPKGEPVEIRVPENGLIDVPAEATAKDGTGTIVYCGVANGVQLITKTQGYNVITHANVGGTAPFNPSESLATQVLQAALNAEKNSAEAKDVADGLRNDAANGKFDGKDGAKGDKGETGTTPQLKIGEDNLWHVSYDNGATWVSLGVKATGAAGKDGADGVTPHIGENGNWWVGNTDTGVSAKGPKGDTGAKGADGVSPTASVTQTDDGAEFTVTDASGTTTATIRNGTDGKDGAPGAPGKDAVVDATLTQDGQAADAKVTGEKISHLEEDTAALQKRQNVLVGSETGNPIAVDDAFSAPLCGLTVYGKSTQDGTPTPDNPVPIVSAGDSGSVAVKVTGKNLFYEQEFQNYFINSVANTVGLAVGNVSCVLQVVTGAKYYVTRNKIGTKFRVAVVDKLPTSGNPVTPSSGINADSKRQVEISTTSKYMVIQCEDEAAFSELMVSLDSSTTYSPYREQLLALSTPNGLPGIPVTSGGNYTDQNGQQWICDEIDLERGVRVQRIASFVIDAKNANKTFITNVYTKVTVATSARLATPQKTNRDDRFVKCVFCEVLPWSKNLLGNTINSINFVEDDSVDFVIENSYLGLSEASTDDERKTALVKYFTDNPCRVVYKIATPIETPLTPAEIAAYKALTAYAPDTVVQASDGAGVKLEYQRDVNIVIKKFEDAIASMTTT